MLPDGGAIGGGRRASWSARRRYADHPMLDSGRARRPSTIPPIQRVLEAAARKGVTLEVTVFDESTHTAAEAAAAARRRARPDRQVARLRRARRRTASSRSCAWSPGRTASTVARLAAVTGEPDIRRATAREAHDLTGFTIGGIPPIGHPRPDPGDHGSRPRALPGRLGGRRPPDRGLPGPAGDAADARERDGGADRRGADAPIAAEAAAEPSSEARPPVARRADPRGRRRRTPRHDSRTPLMAARAAQRDHRLPGRTARAMALGRQRLGAGGLRPVSEAGGTLIDLGPRVAADPDALCRAELRLEGPRGAWTARFASLIHDEPRGLTGTARACWSWPTASTRSASTSRPGEARWEHRSATPIIALLGSSRLAHVLVQAELETFAIEPDGTVAWRIAHSDVVTAAELVGGRLVLTSFDGQVSALDPATGRAAA